MKKKNLSIIIFAAVLSVFPFFSGYAADTVSADEEFRNAVKTDNAVITLTSDWVVGASAVCEDGFLIIPSGKKLTVDLNGFTIDNSGNSGRVFYLEEKAVLKIIDSNPENNNYSSAIKGGVITGGRSYESGGAIFLDENSKLEMVGGSIVGCVSNTDGGAIYIDDGASAVINGTGFYTNRIYDSNTECYGGAICCDGGKVTLKNCLFEGNYSEDDGGAVYLDTDSACEINGCRFLSNYARENGGAVYVNGSGGSTFKNNTVSQNSASELGGGICINADRVYLFDNVITENKASEDGGGIYVDSLYDINACGALVIENNSDNNGKSDLCLQSGVASTAHLNCGGFTEGARIGIDIADDDEAVICEEISIFQFRNYLFADSGKLSFKREKVIAENFVSSAIGKGSIKAIVIIGVVFAAFSIGIPLVILKRRKAVKKNENK